MQAFSTNISKDQGRDTGMAMVLLLLIAFIFTRRSEFVVAAMVVHIVNMTVPGLFRPVAVVWLGFSHLLGKVVSTIVLATIFLLVVTPVALVRRWLGKDSLRLRAFKVGTDSVMVQRNHMFTGRDIEKPF
jgi:hypothetical protein